MGAEARGADLAEAAEALAAAELAAGGSRFKIWRQILLERLLNFADSSLVVSALPFAINLRLTNVLAFSLFANSQKKKRAARD